MAVRVEQINAYTNVCEMLLSFKKRKLKDGTIFEEHIKSECSLGNILAYISESLKVCKV